jgi:hypothetical protein
VFIQQTLGVESNLYSQSIGRDDMAEGDGSEFQRKAAFTFFALLFVAGVLVYWGWGLIYGTWYPLDRGNIGIYTIYTPLIAFGLIGMVLFRKKRPEQ